MEKQEAQMSGNNRKNRNRKGIWIALLLILLAAALMEGCATAYEPRPWRNAAPRAVTPPGELAPGRNHVTYESDGHELAGLLFLPPDYREGERRPAVVVTRPGSGVKEQTAGLYAEKLSRKGFVAIAFDPKGFGESQGRPQGENPMSIISDTRNTMTYLASLPQVDADGIYNLGICMGAGYATFAAALDERSKGAAAVSPYLTTHIDYPKTLGGKGITRLMTWFVNTFRAPADEYEKDYFMYVVPDTELRASLPGAMPVVREMSVYYLPGKPGDVPNWKNELNIYYFEEFISYNPFEMLPALNKRGIPFFMAYAENGYSTEKLNEFYDSVETADKELVVVEGAGHFDLYYKPEIVDPLVEKISSFFIGSGS